jgi:hypothetical protein
VTAEGAHVGATVAGLGDVNGDGVPDVLVGAPGWNDSAGAVFVIYGHRGDTQGDIPLNATAYGPPSSEGTMIADSNGPSAQSGFPYGSGNPLQAPAQVGGSGNLLGVWSNTHQILEQTEEAFYEYGNWQYCSNYMEQRGDQAGSAAASANAGSFGFALVGAPSYGTSNDLSWHGSPGNPTVWFKDKSTGAVGQLGVSAYGSSGEADWAVTPGGGAAYVLAFDQVPHAAPAG